MKIQNPLKRVANKVVIVDQDWDSNSNKSDDEEEKIIHLEESKINNFEESKDEMQPIEPHEDFIKIAPNIEKEQIEKMNTLRIQKIRQIMSEEFKIQGVKLFDLHLLNLKRYHLVIEI